MGDEITIHLDAGTSCQAVGYVALGDEVVIFLEKGQSEIYGFNICDVFQFYEVEDQLESLSC